MSIDYRNAQLCELYDFQYGTGNTIEDIGGDYPIYGSNGIVGYTSKYNSENSPVIGHIGAYAGIVNWANGKHYVTYNGVICRIKTNINPRFGYYALLNSNLQSRLRGSTQPFVSYDLLNEVKTYLPEKNIQDNIAKILSDLDSKIALNNRINAELEAMAKTVYDYWFVQFDFPFDFAQGKPSAEGKPYKSSGGKMVWNEELKRELPEGWGVKKLKEIADTGSGGTPLSTEKAYYANGTIPWINSGEVNEPFIVSAKKYITKEGVDNSSAKLFNKGAILMAMYGATAGKVSIIDIEATTNQAVCGIIPKQDYYRAYLKFGLEDLYRYLINLSTGSARDNLSQDKIKELQFRIPNEHVLKAFDKIADSAMSKILSNMKENQQLSSLRDWLLPMLMNGQVSAGAQPLTSASGRTGSEGRQEEEWCGGMVAEEIPTYKLPVRSNIPDNKRGFAKQVLGGKIVKMFKDDNQFTHIKFQKLQYLAEQIIEEDLDWNYYRQMAGPYDNKFMHSVFNRLEKNSWFRKSGNKYHPLGKVNDIDKYYQNYFGDKSDKLNKLFDLLQNGTEKFCEAVATIYAVWNNHIILKQEFDKECVKVDFFDWSNRKAIVFTEDEFEKALSWMLNHEIVPTGFGNLIKEKK